MVGCNKVTGANGAVGYWGRNMRCTIGGDQTLQKMRALLQDQLLGGGIKAELWTSVHDVRDGEVVDPGTLRCSCVKVSGESADRRCNSCYGIGYAPGYVKFGYQTLWVSSISPGSTIVGLALNTVLKPNRLELAPTDTTGNLETSDLYFTKLQSAADWEYRNDYVVKDGANSSVVASFSTDGGTTWAPIAHLTLVNPSTGRIRFRVVLTRSSLSIASPSWEILRARFATIVPYGPRDIDGSYRLGPWVLVLKAVSADKNIADIRGVQIDSASNTFWTAPLSFFDCTRPQQTGPGSYFDEANEIRDPAFIQFVEGARNAKHDQRWALTNYTYSDPMGYMVRQFFQARLTQLKEHTSLVF